MTLEDLISITLLTIIKVFALLKVWVWMQGLRIYGVYMLYRKKEEIFKHAVYINLDSLYTDEELFNTIPDRVRREIFRDIFRIEVMSLNDIMHSFRDIVYAHKSFLGFMQYHKSLSSFTMIELFLQLYNAHRDKLGNEIQRRLRKNGIDKDTALYIVHKFYSFTKRTSAGIRNRLELQKAESNNLYHVVKAIFREVKTEIELEKDYLPEDFSTLNGRLDNILYKGQRTKIETNPNIPTGDKE